VAQGSKRDLAKLAKVEVEALTLIRRDGAHSFGEVVLEVEKSIQETLELMKLADVYTVSKLVEKFDEGSKPFDGSSNFGLKDLDAIFALDFLEVDKNRLRSDRSG
jgi:hypothetical protein